MKFDNVQFREFKDALLKAFPREFALKEMLQDGLGKSLEEITLGKNLREKVSDVADDAQTKGWLTELLTAAIKLNPNNSELKDFTQKIGFKNSIQKSESEDSDIALEAT